MKYTIYIKELDETWEIDIWLPLELWCVTDYGKTIIAYADELSAQVSAKRCTDPLASCNLAIAPVLYELLSKFGNKVGGK